MMDELNRKLDHLSSLIQKAEQQIVAEVGRLPIRACVCYSKYDGELFFLGLQKVDAQLRICHAINNGSRRAEDFPWKPLSLCSAEQRVQAAGAIPQLWKRVREAKKSLCNLDEAIMILDEAVNDLDG